ncbi:MAG: molybdenum cofactor guanylyltransferase [Verrucomicrobiota bacterium]|jgi:molybdopterin-guanine dinucleotide biosynthesis protein A
MITLTAMLLIGGESRRMGRDKATIEFEGQPLWKRQLGILRRVSPERILISARTLPSWLPDDVEPLLDDPPSRGPLSGLTKALAVMRTTHLLALAVDMPFMTSEQMVKLWDRAAIGCGVLPMIGERAEPLAAIYPKEAAGDFSAALAGTDFSLQRVSRNLVESGKLLVFQVPAASAELYQSVNEPGDIKEGRFPNRPQKP